MPLEQKLIPFTTPVAKKEQIIERPTFRLTVLSPCMLRVEINSKNHFCDSATQAVWFRDFYSTPFLLEENDVVLAIKTEQVTFYFNKRDKKVEGIKLLNEEKLIKCNNSQNLKGTARTLDMTFGFALLGKGIMSKKGVSILDDSKSMLLNDKGELENRKYRQKDYYVFAYGRDYRKALSDFYNLTGSTPLVPRFALGNWWSRYKNYSQEEYVSLMQRFVQENIPITVATVDMDWHWSNRDGINKRFGTDFKMSYKSLVGWTGYTWNTELFPDYKEFLKWLQEHNFKVTLNLHPADGIRCYEAMYSEMAQAMGIDPSTKKTVPFDFRNPKFINNYFKIVHNPYEAEGVDFWWIDWQQGKKDGFDPLWALNHYHFLDNAKGNNRPLILSRYAKAGSHRYPLGFSGDTIMNWASLKYQPYFTATAANIGYSWWSHDIGGHTFGYRNDELYTRWLQYGVFSPINRLHSSTNPLLGKEPWYYSKEVEEIAKEYLTLRHKLIPYIYTANYITHKIGTPLCEPMYYSYPEEKNAYKYKTQYMFGSELLVAPIVSKSSHYTLMGKTKVWLPKGRWTDIFTGRVYNGDCTTYINRYLKDTPVFAKEGAIIPLSENTANDSKIPSVLSLLVYRGTNSYDLYEDDGETNKYETESEFSFTHFEVVENESGFIFTINPVNGYPFLSERTYRVKFPDIADASIRIRKNGIARDITEYKEGEYVSITVSTDDKLSFEILSYKLPKQPDYMDEVIELFSKWQGSNLLKNMIFSQYKRGKNKGELLKRLKLLPVPTALKIALREVLEN